MVGVETATPADFWRAQNGTNHITPGGKWTPEGAWLADFLAGLAGKEIVEFGCGPGRLAQHFDPARYLGLDITPNAIAVAEEWNPGHCFRLVDEDETIGAGADAVLCHTVLVHVPDDDLDGVIGRFAAPVVLVNEMLGRRWRRDGTPPVFNREMDEYVAAFAAHGYALTDVREEIYAHYNQPMALMEFRKI